MRLFVVVTGLVPFEAGLVHAQHKILFLHLQMRNDSITILQSDVRPGILKHAQDTTTANGIEYQCRSSVGTLLFGGAIEDPSVRRYEYEDSTQPGTLRLKVVKLPSVVFTLRIPFSEDIHHIEFYRVCAPGISSHPKEAVRVFLGAVEIQSNAGRQ